MIHAYSLVYSVVNNTAPTAVMASLMQRLSVFIEQLKTTDPTISYSLPLTRSLMATFRGPGPWTLVNESQRVIEIGELIGDTLISLSHRAGVVEWGWLDLGDREGVERRLLALAPVMEKTQEMSAVGLWRHLLARVFCLSREEESWTRAEQLVAPLCEPTAGIGVLSFWAQGVMARLSLLRGRVAQAEAQARALMQFFPSLPILLAHIAPVHIRALLGLGRASEAVAVAVQVLDAIPTLGGYGVAEVEFRLAASEAFHANDDVERAQTELRETLRQVQLRADDITDVFWKNSYLTRNPYVVRAQALAQQWGLGVVVS